MGGIGSGTLKIKGNSGLSSPLKVVNSGSSSSRVWDIASSSSAWLVYSRVRWAMVPAQRQDTKAKDASFENIAQKMI